MSIQYISENEFRQKLAGITKKSELFEYSDKTNIEESAISLCKTLYIVASDDFDRRTLWEKVGNSLIVCSAKCGGDIEMFVSQLLESVKSDHQKVAQNKWLIEWLKDVIKKPKEWHLAMIKMCTDKSRIIIIKSQWSWKESKSKNEDETDDKNL